MAIVVVIAGFGLFLSFDFYKTYSFASERNIIVSALQKARNQAIVNFNGKPHGVRFDSTHYILFEGSSFDPFDSHNNIIDKSPVITVSSLLPLPAQIVFSQLSGDVMNSGTIIISDSVKQAAISINPEGGIEW